MCDTIYYIRYYTKLTLAHCISCVSRKAIVRPRCYHVQCKFQRVKPHGKRMLKIIIGDLIAPSKTPWRKGNPCPISCSKRSPSVPPSPAIPSIDALGRPQVLIEVMKWTYSLRVGVIDMWKQWTANYFLPDICAHPNMPGLFKYL